MLNFHLGAAYLFSNRFCVYKPQRFVVAVVPVTVFYTARPHREIVLFGARLPDITARFICEVAGYFQAVCSSEM